MGLMSGTSADGIDAALVALSGAPPTLNWRVVHHLLTPYPDDVRAETFACFRPEQGTTDRLCALNFALGRAFADAAQNCIRSAGLTSTDVDLIGSHGQTIWHIPTGPAASTLQLGEAAVIAERTGITTISNFRVRDMAVGGQGAPLVAYVDQLLFTHPALSRTALNIGGIANFTFLPARPTLAPKRRGSLEAFAFDTGPGNMLIDDAVRRATNGTRDYDHNGEMAAQGHVSDALFEELMDHPYIAASPPKTTGREMFGAQLGEQVWQRALSMGLTGQDIVATLTMVTAASIAHAHRIFLPQLPDEVIVSGGGAHNSTLMRFLQQQLAPARVYTSDQLGMSVESKEAVAFAVLAYETWHNRAGNLPRATGASKAVVLGHITPGNHVGRTELSAPAKIEKSAEASTLGGSPLTEAVNPATRNIDTLGAQDIVDLINAEDSKVALAVASQRVVIAQAIDAIAARVQAGGRLIYIGAGTSGRLGVLDASEMPPTYNATGLVIGRIAGGEIALTRPVEGAEDDAEMGRGDITELGVTVHDCVLGISANGGAAYVLGALAEAKALGALTLGLTCNADTPLHRAADIVIAPLVGPEVVSGSTRMKAGTATKLVLNTLSTGVMIRLGKTYGNLMVDVQATNKKLRERARRIVSQACTIPLNDAADLLAQADGDVKTAIVMYLANVALSEARSRLAQTGGVVRRAIHNA